MKKLRIYLAGPDVFRPDAKARGEYMKAFCAQLGFEGVFPLDNEFSPGIASTSLETAIKIFNGNIKAIKTSDIVVANLDPFRGFEPDSGTCFECGVAYALGLQIFGYADDLRPMITRFKEYDAIIADGLRIENFGLPFNLMLAVPATLVKGSFEECLATVWRSHRVHKEM